MTDIKTNKMVTLYKALTRLKRNDASTSAEESKLARVLNLFDLTFLGIGSTLGLGVYVLAGSVAYENAGPAVTISFLIAAIASSFAGLCYAEFAARVPKAGSAYIYSYVTIGEFVAFNIGWNLILEYVIGTSSVARGLTGYLDSLVNNTMGNYMKDVMPINVSFLAEYPDFLSFILIMLITALLAFGVKESTMLNNIFTTINIATVLLVIISGSLKADPKNWRIPKESIPPGIRGGEGGFMPYGFMGVVAGAAKCFYGFVGFDCVATTGEEAINPKRNIPLSIVISLLVIFFSYFGISTVLTMMWPYYLQDPNAPFPHVYQEIGWIEIKWIVTIGAMFALCTSLLGAMFPLPRILYAMGSDGIIFKCFKSVNDYTKTPLRSTIIAGFLAAVMALIFNLQQLIDMMSIGTLLAYTIVAICVLVLRYEDTDMTKYSIQIDIPVIIKQLFNINFIKYPNNLTSYITKFCIIIYTILSIVLCIILSIFNYNNITIICIIIILASMILMILIMWRQPITTIELTFKVPLVPLIPCISILMNLYLMFQLDIFTWIRFLVWIGIGYIIYFGYGIRNSIESKHTTTSSSKLKDQQQHQQINNFHLSNMKK